ncbi:hypothetical protein LZ012_14010 [Dechloromonas sp. XY25]|uniref:Uncharacterized protein n=1 Tax=Dechloromonas hankyongensis TaxID=2908002 RepID=A0ABS9K4T5_9RHOO|nr:hypothetical protein [Dechloromonas hankyongensis]MCG2578105.1 hypothetical protein [Dechloromonas hankyongensis]
MVGAVGGVGGGLGIGGAGMVGSVADAASAAPAVGSVPASPPSAQATAPTASSQVSISPAARQALAAEIQQMGAPMSATTPNPFATVANGNLPSVSVSLAVNALNNYIQANGVNDTKFFNDMVAAVLLAILLQRDQSNGG